MQQKVRTLPVGRALRALLGGVMLVWALPSSLSGLFSPVYLVALALMLALLLLYLGVHWVVAHHFRALPHSVGLLIAAGPPGLVFFLGLPGGWIFGQGEGAVAVLLYIGASLIVMAARGDPGCEVVAIQTWIFKRHVHLPCLLFSPIDALERRWRRGGWL